HEELIAEMVGMLDSESFGIALIDQHKWTQDGQACCAGFFGIRIDVRKQTGVESGEELIVREGFCTVAPRILTKFLSFSYCEVLFSLSVDLPVHLHDRREAGKLGPTQEQIGAISRRSPEIRVLVSPDIVAPNRITRHCRGQTREDHTGQTIRAKVGLVVSGPVSGKSLP